MSIVQISPEAPPVEVLKSTETEGEFSVWRNRAGRYAVLVRGKPSATKMYLEGNVDGNWVKTDELENDDLTDSDGDGTYEGGIAFWLAAGVWRITADTAGPTAHVGAADSD